MLVKFVMIFAVFYAGRISANIAKNRYLEEKRGELIAYHQALLDISEQLELKDKTIKQKWQTMVDDISKYQAYVNPEDTGKWTDMDDIYLQSWKSAEK